MFAFLKLPTDIARRMYRGYHGHYPTSNEFVMDGFIGKISQSNLEIKELIGGITFDGIEFHVTKVFWNFFRVESRGSSRIIFSPQNRSIWIKHKLPNKIWFFKEPKSLSWKINSECVIGWDEHIKETVKTVSFRGIIYKSKK